MTDKKLIDYMDSETMSRFWAQRRRIAWSSFTGIWVVLSLEAASINIDHGDTFIWAFVTIVLAYFAGNAVSDISNKIK